MPSGLTLNNSRQPLASRATARGLTGKSAADTPSIVKMRIAPQKYERCQNGSKVGMKLGAFFAAETLMSITWFREVDSSSWENSDRNKKGGGKSSAFTTIIN